MKSLSLFVFLIIRSKRNREGSIKYKIIPLSNRTLFLTICFILYRLKIFLSQSLPVSKQLKVLRKYKTYQLKMGTANLVKT